MKIGGWWRFWIAISAIYGSAVAAYTWDTFPTLSSAKQWGDYLSRMAPEAQAILRIEPERRPFKPESRVDERSPLAAIDRVLYDDRVIDRIKMPDGNHLEVASKVPEQQKNLVAREYTRLLHSALLQQRIEAVVWALIYWLGPALLLCGLGLTTKWIHKGFKQQ